MVQEHLAHAHQRTRPQEKKFNLPATAGSTETVQIFSMTDREWFLWRDGAMPMTKKACPMWIKIALIAAYRYNSFKADDPVQEKGVSLLSVFLPLVVTVFIWLTTCIPSVVTRTRNPLATTVYVIFGLILTSVYWTLVSAALAYAKNLGMLAGYTAAVHFAWFSSPAHVDSIHGGKNILNIMRVCIVTILYCTLVRIPKFPHIPDGAFIITVWSPEIINIILNTLFNPCAEILISMMVNSDEKDK
jgi:hypothetical protein